MKNDFFFVKMDKHFIKVALDDLLYLEGAKNYTKLITAQRTLLVHVNLKEWEKILPTERFIRIHRSFIVSLEKIISFEFENVTVGTLKIPISEGRRKAFMESIIIVQKESENQD